MGKFDKIVQENIVQVAPKLIKLLLGIDAVHKTAFQRKQQKTI